MSGGPPHHPHNRQVPGSNLGNTAWNHLQVPNFFPRQPQLAHMSNEHSMLHQPTWHTPTTEALKNYPHSHVLSEMFKNESLFPRDCVDLSLTRNGNQNGELAPAPISLSVRDTNKINSLLPSALDIQAVELTKSTSPAVQSSPNRKSISPGLKSSPSIRSVPYPKTSSPAAQISTASSLFSAGSSLFSTARNLNQNIVSSGHVPKSASPGLKPSSPIVKPASPGLKLFPTNAQGLFPSITPEVVKTSQKRSNVRVDSILERLNPTPDRVVNVQEDKPSKSQETEATSIFADKPVSVIVQTTTSGFDENSNSSSINNVPVMAVSKDEDTVSTNSNDDNSADSTKSRRKRKPSKTIRVSKDDERIEEVTEMAEIPIKEVIRVEEKDPISIMGEMLEDNKNTDKEESPSDLEDLISSTKRRKTSSESETIDDIAAMVQESLKEKEQKQQKALDGIKQELVPVLPAKPISVSVIKTKENLAEVLSDTGNIKAKENLAAVLSDSSHVEVKENLTALFSDMSPIKTKDNLTDVLSDKSQISVKENFTEVLLDTKEIETKDDLTDVLLDSTHDSSTPVPSVDIPVPPPLVTPAEKKTTTDFVEVENKLEEMFAGIEDTSEPVKTAALDLDDSKVDDPLLKLDDGITPSSESADEANSPKKTKTEDIHQEDDEKSSISKEVTSQTETDEQKTPVKKTKRKAAPMASPVENTPKKKKVIKVSKPKSQQKGGSVAKKPQKVKPTGKLDIAKDIYAYDSGSNTSSTKSKGPFIQIKGPRDSPLSVNVINFATNDEESERKLPKSKKFHDDSEYRHKVRSKGLHSSTLSNKYDAQTRDATWICAFCKRGPHASELAGPTVDRNIEPPGDLFGPYFITTQCPEFERRLDDPYDRQFKSKKITKALDEAATVASRSKKSKRKHSDSDGLSESESDIYLGITATGNKTYEVWAHEDCIVWSHGTYLIGPKIVGLEAAVWTCCNVTCKSCHLKGANILCFRRGCLNAAHISCARKNAWQFVESNFKAYCPDHRVP
uniref:Uncharacterized protein CG5098 isoform X1 n=1 Tax=Diabrotica virgifera virgifera TaxID=50390 RepID=A0A6P7G1I5_DIAVI